MTIRRALVATAAVAWAGGCGGSENPGGDPVACTPDGACTPDTVCDLATRVCVAPEDAECVEAPCREPVAEVGPAANPALDLLFVVDDSGAQIVSMPLADTFDAFVAALDRRPGGRPDLHVGVVSQDMGAGDFGIDRCDATGEDGALQTAPRIPGCEGPDGSFLRDVAASGGREVNYPGTLAEAFACIGRLGIDGCGFEQPLAAALRALEPDHPANAGFRRPGAVLGVLVFMDEDDCSATDPAVYDPGPDDVHPTFGPLSSFRCFEYGVTCESTDDPRAIGPRAGCRPREDSPYLLSMTTAAAELRARAGAAPLVVATVIGPASPLEVYANNDGDPELANSCGSEIGAAGPGVRLHAFAESYGVRGLVRRACDTDYAPLLEDIAGALLRASGVACVTAAITDPPDCVGELVGDDDRVAGPLPACDDAGPGQACWRLVADSACDAFPSGLALEVEAGDTMPPPARLRCRTP